MARYDCQNVCLTLLNHMICGHFSQLLQIRPQYVSNGSTTNPLAASKLRSRLPIRELGKLSKYYEKPQLGC